MTDYGICENPDCPFPGRRVKSPEVPVYPVTGWEVSRTGGGANAIKLRQRVPNRVRHLTCLPTRHDNQETLL